VSPVAVAAIFAVILLLLVGGFLAVETYNSVVGLRQRIDKAWANIEVSLQQRYDQLPALVSAVRDVMDFEEDVLEEVTRLRAAWSPAQPVGEQAEVSLATTTAVKSLLFTIERYPALRSQDNVLALQGQIERLESMIADRRELYNDQVYRHNTRIAQFPAIILAFVFAWRPRPFFDAEDAADARPSVDLRDTRADEGGDPPPATSTAQEDER
jgi:LemA protein